MEWRQDGLHRRDRFATTPRSTYVVIPNHPIGRSPKWSLRVIRNGFKSSWTLANLPSRKDAFGVAELLEKHLADRGRP